MWTTLSTNKKQLARESFSALSACSCHCFEFLLVPLDCISLLWVTWLTRLSVFILILRSQLNTFQLDDTLTYHGVTDQGPLWCGLSATFQISWVNSTILLNSSSAAYKNWRKNQFIFLLSTMALLHNESPPRLIPLRRAYCSIKCVNMALEVKPANCMQMIGLSTKDNWPH